MTAEIAVMNAQAVALAADSAATVALPRGQKIYNSVNKLFTLSKFAPVGVMIYGSSTLTGTPWETIIKEFRRELGDTRHSTLQQYADALIAFLERKPNLFPRGQEENEIRAHAMGFYSQIVREFQEDMAKRFSTGASVSQTEIRRALSQRIRASVEAVDQAPASAGYPSDYCAKLQGRFDAVLEEAIAAAFENLPLSARDRARLKGLICTFMSKQVFPNLVSGVVVAGFGEEEHFPSLVAYDTQSVLMGKVKYQQNSAEAISGTVTASIHPFAQREMVDLFIQGVAPAYATALDTALEGLLTGIGSLLGRRLGGVSSKALQGAMKSIQQDFRDELRRYSQANHIDPILNAVAVLPKDALAEMAESLVNLTSFKRRVTMDPETVGGPIDVAVISKGDGFIWIRRKHYFKPELNPHFFANYFR